MKPLRLLVVLCSCVFVCSAARRCPSGRAARAVGGRKCGHPPFASDAEKALFLEKENARLFADIQKLRTQCQQAQQEAASYLTNVTQDMNKLQADLQTAKDQANDLQWQLNSEKTFHAQELATIQNLTQQLIAEQSEADMLARTNITLEEQNKRCEDALNASSSVEVQVLIQQWTAHDQAMISELNQEAANLTTENGVLQTCVGQLKRKTAFNQKTITVLLKQVDEQRKDIREEMTDTLDTQFEEKKLERELEQQKSLVDQCQREMTRLTQ